MRKNQKGFTIVELLIAITILSIVVAVVCGFILVGSRSYAAGNSDINVQQEAQLALNQMSDVMIDTTRSVNYVGYDPSGNPVHTLKDAEFAFTPEDKSLIMFNGVVVKDPSGGADTIEEGNGNKHYHFYWNKAQETLYYAEQDVDPAVVKSEDIMSNFPDVADADPDADPTVSRWYVLAQHVTDFSVDLSQLEEKRVVQLALTFMDGTKEYVTSNNVTIRNKVGVNDAELAPLNRNVEVDVVVKPTVILEPGETFVLPTPNVTGKNVTDKSVTWSFLDSPDDASLRPDDRSDETTLTTDGILKLSIYVQGSFRVKATANAENADGSHSSAEITVNVKRVKDITLWKSHDSDPGNGPNEISPGCTFTISGTVIGDFLDQTCDACGEDTSIDRHILSKKSPILGGDVHVWRVWDPHLPGEEWALSDPAMVDWHPLDHIDEVDQDEYSATFRVRPNVSDAGDHGYVFQVMSLLSYYRPYGSPTYKGRCYDWVWPSISFKVVKSKEEAEPYGGSLKYGEQTLDESIREGLSTDHPKYATAIRVVDNSGKEPDKVLLYFTIGGGANYRICPDLFDLDLNGSYTFYMQAIDPVSAENRRLYQEGKLGQVIEDDAAAIREEYFSHLNTSKPYGYVGTKYPHGKVFYAKLDRPKITFTYKEVDYKGKNVTYDPVSIYSVGKGSGIIGEIKPSAYESIESNNGMEGMRYSLYEGAGSSQSGWKKWYYFDDSVMEYQGDKKLGGNVVEVNPGGNPYMKLDGDDRLQACGDYHIVPGMLYQNKSYDHYEIIGWSGFDYDKLPRNVRYYEFNESTIHVKVDTLFNLKLWSYYDGQFTKGEIHFPTPSETEFTSYFDLENREWQNAKNISSWGPNFVKSIEGTDNTTTYHPSSMRCRYVADRKVYELELFYEYNDSMWDRKREVSAGVYQCAANGTEWEQKTPGKYDSQLESGNMNPQLGPTANVDFTLWGNRHKGKMYIPLPSESAFAGYGFDLKKTDWQTKDGVNLKYQPENQQSTQGVWIPKLKYRYNAGNNTYEIVLTDQNDGLLAGFTCKNNGDRWEQW